VTQTGSRKWQEKTGKDYLQHKVLLELIKVCPFIEGGVAVRVPAEEPLIKREVALDAEICKKAGIRRESQGSVFLSQPPTHEMARKVEQPGVDGGDY